MSPAERLYDSLIPLMKSKGVTLTPANFHHLVNLMYHHYEAPVYDTDHREMWDSLPLQFELLIKDLRRHTETFPEKIEMLDVGCGTGLASALLLQTELGKHISHIDLLDTSSEMLAKCRLRASGWSTQHQMHLGTLEDAPKRNYDLILVSSVLHHVPDLPAFLQQVRARQKKGGYFIHIQDPNADYIKDPQLIARQKELKDASQKRTNQLINLSLIPFRISKRLLRLFRQGPANKSKNHLDLLNAHLLETGVITSSMSDEEIWSITDIHVDNLPFSTRNGISLNAFKIQLPDYELISQRSYAFFGRLWSTLPPQFQARELQLIQDGAPNGYKIAAIWKHV